MLYVRMIVRSGFDNLCVSVFEWNGSDEQLFWFEHGINQDLRIRCWCESITKSEFDAIMKDQKE